FSGRDPAARQKMNSTKKTTLFAAALAATGAAALIVQAGAQQTTVAPAAASAPNVYAETGANKFSPAVQGHLERVYVPNLRANEVYVIDPATAQVDDRVKVG